MSKAKYPWLEGHRIAKPCKEDWEKMTGDEKARFCGKCRLNVYNLSAMSSEEAEALLAKNNGQICTTFFMRADGTALTQDCPIGIRETWRQRGLLAAVAYAFAIMIGNTPLRADESMSKGGPEPQKPMIRGEPPMRTAGAPPPAPPHLMGKPMSQEMIDAKKAEHLKNCQECREGKRCPLEHKNQQLRRIKGKRLRAGPKHDE